MTFSTDPSQQFTSIINEERFDFLVVYNPSYDLWNMTIDQNGVTLAAGINLVTQTNLTEQYPGIPFEMRSEYPEDANRDNIGEFELTVTLKDG